MLIIRMLVRVHLAGLFQVDYLWFIEHIFFKIPLEVNSMVALFDVIRATLVPRN